jgi:hypothetical protein
MLAQEGHLASVTTLTGFEFMLRMDYDRVGTIYSTFFELAAGLERMMKLAVVIDYMVNNSLKPPTDKEMRGFGHAISDLYARCKEMSDHRGLTKYDWADPSSIGGQMLAVLSSFAKSARYYNLDQIVGGRSDRDPLSEWFEVQMDVVHANLSSRVQSDIMERCRDFCEQYGMFGYEWGPAGRYDLTIDVNWQLAVFKRTRGHCVWVLIETLRPLYGLFVRLTEEIAAADAAAGLDRPSVPYMEEFFPFLLTDRADALRRTKWRDRYYIAGRF